MSSDNGPRFVDFAALDGKNAENLDCSKQSGQFHSMKGNAVETVGNLTGSTDWQRSGKQEHAEGEGEYDAARAKGYAEGTADRFKGKKDSVVGSVTGDRSQEAAGVLKFE